MFGRLKFKVWVRWAGVILLLGIVIGFVGRRHGNTVCDQVYIHIDNEKGHYFLDKKDILQLLTNNGDDYLIGTKYKNINTEKLELRVKNNKFVSDCQVFHNLRGALSVEVKQVEPIARFLNIGEKDFYIDLDGNIFEVSSKYTARVLVVTQEKDVPLPNFEIDKEDQALLDFIRKIHQNPVWRAQIAQIHLNRFGEVTLWMQIGKPKVLLGKLTDIDDKLKKIDILYQKILPYKGWETYKTVNLMYHNQIICE